MGRGSLEARKYPDYRRLNTITKQIDINLSSAQQ